MRKVFTILAATMIAGAAHAADVSGEVTLDAAENASGNWAVTTGFELGVDATGLGSVDLDFTATDGGAVTLDKWTVGTEIGGIGIAVGNDNGVMPEAFDENHNTLATPAMTDSVKLSFGDATVALGFTDWSTDATEISNVQGSYTLNLAGLDVKAAGDYNLDTKNYVIGADVSGVEVSGIALGGAVTWDKDAEVFGYEANANAYGVTAYMNGDNNKTLQNLGGEYSYLLGGAALKAGVNYNLDSEEFTPTVGVSFSF